MTFSFDKRVSVPSDTLISVIDGESVVLNLTSETYYGLDEIGTRMWAALTGCDTIQAAYEALLSEYEVEAEQLRLDLSDFVKQLESRGLVELSDG